MRKGMKMPRNPMSVEQSAAAVIDWVSEFAPPGVRSPDSDAVLSAAAIGSMYLKWDLAWGLDASIRISWEGDGDGEYFHPQIRVTWCSTHYDPAQAVASAHLNLAVAEFACLLTAKLDGHKSIITSFTKELPKEKP